MERFESVEESCGKSSRSFVECVRVRVGRDVRVSSVEGVLDDRVAVSLKRERI